MSGKSGIQALLRASKKSSALHTAVNAGISNADAWPTTEHDTLKAALRKDKFFTDLMLIHRMNQVPLGEALASIDSKDQPGFIVQHNNARSYRIDGTVTNKGSLYNFERRLAQLIIYVVQHVKEAMQELSLISSKQKNLFTSDTVDSGAVSQDALLRKEMQLQTLVNDILAKNLLSPGKKEDEKVLDLVVKEHNLNKGTLSTEDTDSVAAQAVLYKKSLANMRELFTYYILYSFGILCKEETVDQLKILQQQHFLSVAYKTAPDNKKPLFTAQVAIDYLKKECYTDNDRSVTALKRVLERVVRYNGETLFAFMNRFPPLINELEIAEGKTYSEKELNKLWKLNFSKHMSKDEKHAIKLDHGDILSTPEWESIKSFNEGKFDFATMGKLLTQLCPDFPHWKPGKMVKSWNDQRKIDYQWAHDIDYRPPVSSKRDKRDQDSSRDKSSDHEAPKSSGNPGSSKKHKTGRDRDKKKSRHDRSKGTRIFGHVDRGKFKPRRSPKPGRSLLGKNKVTIPFSKQCKEPICIQKGVQATHEWDKCSHRNKGSFGKPNKSDFPKKGKKFLQKGFKPKEKGSRGNSSSSSQFKKKSFGKPSSDRKCWNCGDPGHLSPDCPRQAKINHLLEESEEFTCLLTEQFDTKELWDCSQRMINTYDKKVCWSCCKPSCRKTCTPKSDPLSAFMPEAHEIMKSNPDIGTSILAAIHQVDDDDEDQIHYMAPLNHELYYQSQEGRDSDDSDEEWARELKIPKRSARSRSKSESSSRSEYSDDDSGAKSSHSSESESETVEKPQYHSDDEDS